MNNSDTDWDVFVVNIFFTGVCFVVSVAIASNCVVTVPVCVTVVSVFVSSDVVVATDIGPVETTGVPVYLLLDCVTISVCAVV